MSVDFPAPLGPNRPMDRPVSEPFSFFRMIRSPNRTSRLSSSMTGGICVLVGAAWSGGGAKLPAFHLSATNISVAGFRAFPAIAAGSCSRWW